MSNLAQAHPATRAEVGRERRRGIWRFYGLTLLGTVFPGAGLLAAGRRVWGGLLVLLTVATLGVGGYFAWRNGVLSSALNVAVRPAWLRNLAVGVGVAVAIWCFSIIATAVVARPDRSSVAQKVLGTFFVAIMCVAVVAPSVQVVRYMGIQREVVQTLFTGRHEAPSVANLPVITPDAVAPDPWADIPRVNVLLLGSDSGKDRTGVRTDSMIVASIDTKSGDTTLFGVPRNLQNVPFSEHNPLHRLYPDGYDCGDQCLMNAVWMLAESNRALFPGDTNPGLTATRDAISEVLGLRIDTTAVIDLAGFSTLVDAMGGVDVNVQERIPIGGEVVNGRVVGITGWIEAGRQHMDGYHALWYSRSRATTDDYSRMRRQRCMIGALVSQVNPIVMLEKYPQLASVAKQNVQVDIAQEQLPAWVELVERMQHGTIRSLPFTTRNVSPSHPDFDLIREMVRNALAVGSDNENGAGHPSADPTATSDPSSTKEPSDSASNDGDDDNGPSAGTKTPKPTNTAVARDELVEVKDAC